MNALLGIGGKIATFHQRCERFSIPCGVIAFGYILPRGMEVGVPIDSNPSKRNGRGKATWSFSFLDLRVSNDRSIDRSFIMRVAAAAHNLLVQSRFDESRCRCAISRIVHNCETRRHNGRLIQI